MPSAGMAAGVNSRQFQFPEVKAVEQYGLMDWTAADLLHGLTVNGLDGEDAGIGSHTTTQWNASEMVDSRMHSRVIWSSTVREVRETTIT